MVAMTIDPCQDLRTRYQPGPQRIVRRARKQIEARAATETAGDLDRRPTAMATSNCPASPLRSTGPPGATATVA